MPHQRRPDNQTTAPLVTLTRREMEVLQLLAKGLSNKNIAVLLFLGDRTVQSHLIKIYRKLNVRNRTSAVLAGIAQGIISNP